MGFHLSSPPSTTTPHQQRHLWILRCFWNYRGIEGILPVRGLVHAWLVRARARVCVCVSVCVCVQKGGGRGGGLSVFLQHFIESYSLSIWRGKIAALLYLHVQIAWMEGANVRMGDGKFLQDLLPVGLSRIPTLPPPLYAPFAQAHRILATYLQSKAYNTAGAITSNRTLPQWQPPLCFTNPAAIIVLTWPSSQTEKRKRGTEVGTSCMERNIARLLSCLHVARKLGQNTEILWPWFAN